MTSNLITIIGDVHGITLELQELLDKVPSGSKIISLGDLTDKGPDSSLSCEIMANSGATLVASNHDEKYVDFIRKNRSPESIKNVERRKVYESLSRKAKDYLVSRIPYYEFNSGICVHAGIGPKHNVSSSMDGKTFNEIIRLRYINRNTLEKVSTTHTPEGWGPDIPIEQTWNYQEVYDKRYGTIFHGHNVYSYEQPKLWFERNGERWESYGNEKDDYSLDDLLVCSIDLGGVYGGHLCAAVVDSDTNKVSFLQVKARAEYCAR